MCVHMHMHACHSYHTHTQTQTHMRPHPRRASTRRRAAWATARCTHTHTHTLAMTTCRVRSAALHNRRVTAVSDGNCRAGGETHREFALGTGADESDGVAADGSGGMTGGATVDKAAPSTGWTATAWMCVIAFHSVPLHSIPFRFVPFRSVPFHRAAVERLDRRLRVDACRRRASNCCVGLLDVCREVSSERRSPPHAVAPPRPAPPNCPRVHTHAQGTPSRTRRTGRCTRIRAGWSSSARTRGCRGCSARPSLRQCGSTRSGASA